jgi:hypothetical protein
MIKLISLHFYIYIEIIVSELMGRVRNVILMNVYLGLENPRGSGFWVGGYMSQVREMRKSVHEQPGNEVDGSYHSQESSIGYTIFRPRYYIIGGRSFYIVN